MFYDVDLLCIACRVRPIYKHCSRLGKKICAKRYRSRCLQCFLEQWFCVGGRSAANIFTSGGMFTICVDKLECRCHRNYMLLVFPSFILFASAYCKKLLMKVRITETLAIIMSDDVDGPNARVDSRIANRNSSSSSSGVGAGRSLLSSSSTTATVVMWNIERKEYVDRHYLFQIIAEFTANHFMLCSGRCPELRSVLPISSVSNKTSELINVLSTIIGHSSIHERPPSNIVAEAASLKYRQQHKDGGEEDFIGRIQYHLRMLTCHIEDRDHHQQSTMSLLYSYFPSFQVILQTIVKMVP